MTSTQVRIRRDTAANLNAATPANSELGHDITNKRIVVGDGTTAGGIRIPNANDVQQNTFTYAVAGGTANALTLTLAPALQSYASGAGIIFKAADTNTASATINVNGLGVRTLQKISSGVLVDLVAGDIVDGGVYQALYDGTVFQLKGLAAGGGGFAQSSVLNPTGTTSTTDFMMGAALAYTPTGSGNILINGFGYIDFSAPDQIGRIQIRYGTGTAPSNGDALTGAAVGGLINIRATSWGGPFAWSLNPIAAGLAVGTAYWFDVSLSSTEATICTIKNVTLNVVEL